jgi:hypothetical protein
MFHVKDHKTLNMFDPWAHLGTKRRKLLEQSWAKLFQEEILLELPVHKLQRHYHEFMGRPTKELYAMLGAMILQQMHDLDDDEVVYQFAFNEMWHFALDITGDSDTEAYVSLKTVWNMRSILTKHDLYNLLFETISDKLANMFNVDTSKQRLDSVHIQSNMRHLGRIGLFVNTIKKFLVNLRRQHKELFLSLEKELTGRYFPKRGGSVFSMVKPSESAKTLESLGKDLFSLIERFRDKAEVTSMSSYQLLVRLVKEQCTVEQDVQTKAKKVSVKPNKEVPSDSLQNPSDPDAGYSGHKGKGYQVQVMETYNCDEDKKQLSLITHVNVEPAHKSDANALLPALEDTQKRGVGPEEVLVDAAYGGDNNCEKAKELGVEVISPVLGRDSEKDLTVADFNSSDKGKVIACPQGHAPIKIKRKKDGYNVAFNTDICASCPCLTACPVKPGKKAHYLRYDQKTMRLAIRRAYEKTAEFRDKYRFRAGIEATNSEYDRKTGVKRLRVRGQKAVSYAATLKAAAINILRATAFKNRGSKPKSPQIQQKRDTLGLIYVFKKQCLSSLNNLVSISSRLAGKYYKIVKTLSQVQAGHDFGLKMAA